MSNVVSLKPLDQGYPDRSPEISGLTMLVSVFEHEPALLPFVRHLFNEHGIVTVRQFDRAKVNAFAAFQLDERLQSLFKSKRGRPERTTQSGAPVIPMPTSR